MCRLSKILLSILLFTLTQRFVGAQTITTVVGNCANPGYYGDGGPASLAGLYGPDDLAFDSHGNYYIGDAGSNTVRKVNIATGIISTYAGVYNPNGNSIAGDGGPATLATLYFPSSVALDSNNNLYIADYYDSVVRKVDPTTGVINTFGGMATVYGYSGDGGPATLAEMGSPNIVRMDPGGQFLYLSDAGNSTVRKINLATGIITTVAGTGTAGYTGDGGPATLAELDQPEAMAWDSQGNLYIGDTQNSVIRKVAAGTGVITTVVGNGTNGYSGDGGPAALAELGNDLGSVNFTCNGNLIFTDDMNNRVRMVDKATGVITTVIGTGNSGCSTSGTAVLSTDISHPEAMVYDPSGNLYLVDYDYSLVQVVSGGFCPVTPTATPTATATSTPTSTATPTPSKTPSPTPSTTPTPTVTPSFTPSSTPSPTNTATPTSTTTPTPTPTRTPTSTSTPTPSSTPTKTPTPTNSSTPTVTATSTFSPTPTWGISLSKQVSQTTAQGGATLTYNLAVTVATGSFAGVTVTDPLPGNEAFVALGTVGAGTAAYDLVGSVLTWALPPTLRPGIYLLSYQSQVGLLAPAGTPVVNTAQLTFPGLSQPLSASATVNVNGSYTVKLGVYNEAGELIKSLGTLQLSQSINSLNLQGSSITRLTGSGSQILLYCQGSQLGVWDGTNSSGNPVSNGAYLIEVESIDSNGVVTTVTQQATVDRNLAQVSVAVYNEAGEAVKHLTGWVDDASGNGMTNVVLSNSVLEPGSSNGQGTPNSVQVLIQAAGSAVTLHWDGTDDEGADVTPGEYLLSVHWAGSQGETSVISRTILVTGGGPQRGQAITAAPNFLRISSGQKQVLFTGPSGLTLHVKIYTLTGELAASLTGENETGQVSWDASGFASGLYLAVVENLGTSGGLISRQILKITIIR